MVRQAWEKYTKAELIKAIITVHKLMINSHSEEQTVLDLFAEELYPLSSNVRNKIK